MINEIRNAYYLGNYQEAIDTYTSFKEKEGSFEDQMDVEFIIQKAAVMLSKNCEAQVTIIAIFLTPKSIEYSGSVEIKPIFQDYLAQLESGGDFEEISELYEELKKSISEDSDLYTKMVNNYFAAYLGEYDQFIEIPKAHTCCFKEK